MNLNNKIMIITYADSMGSDLKDLHTVLDNDHKKIWCRYDSIV